jgi:hypothetical protein
MDGADYLSVNLPGIHLRFNRAKDKMSVLKLPANA